MRPDHTVTVDLPTIVANAARIRAATGVFVYAVVKANAYGLGAARVADALADTVDGFYVFTLAEAVAADLARYGKPILAMHTDPGPSADDYRAAGVRPIACSGHALAHLAPARPVLSVDTGMHRFGCPPELAETLVRRHGIDEALTHASRPEQAAELRQLLRHTGVRLHAAGSALLDRPDCHLDAVRPGLALYRDAVTITTPLVETHAPHGPAGYSRFHAEHIGVILAGYADGLRPGPCHINGRPSTILEVGMQSAFIATAPADRPGDPVTLLGPLLPLESLAAASNTTPHETLLRLASLSPRQ